MNITYDETRTPWFPREITPVYDGYYETAPYNPEIGGPFVGAKFYWTGKHWALSGNPNLASQVFSVRVWHGLAINPMWKT